MHDPIDERNLQVQGRARSVEVASLLVPSATASMTAQGKRQTSDATPTRRADGVWLRRDGLERWWPMPKVVDSHPQSRACARCGGPGSVVVLGLKWCEPCAVGATFMLPPAPLTGVGYVIAVCALVQWMRQRVGVLSGVWIPNEEWMDTMDRKVNR